VEESRRSDILVSPLIWMIGDALSKPQSWLLYPLAFLTFLIGKSEPRSLPESVVSVPSKKSPKKTSPSSGLMNQAAEDRDEFHVRFACKDLSFKLNGGTLLVSLINFPDVFPKFPKERTCELWLTRCGKEL